LDWLSHDVQLLSDLFTFDVTISEVQSKINMQDPCTKKYTFKLSNGTLVELKGGASETRISIWRIQDLNGYSCAINFDSKTLESFSDREVLVNSYQSPQSDEPLLNMIQLFLDQSAIHLPNGRLLLELRQEKQQSLLRPLLL
jgi:hypothetical protein